MYNGRPPPCFPLQLSHIDPHHVQNANTVEVEMNEEDDSFVWPGPFPASHPFGSISPFEPQVYVKLKADHP